MWIYTSTPPYAFMAQCLISYAQDNFTFLRVLPQQFERLYFGTTDWEGLGCMAMRWIRVVWYTHQVSWGLMQALKQYSGLASEIWEAVVLVLLMQGFTN
jgi:hypothetical protein